MRTFDDRAPNYDRSIRQRLVFGPVHDAVLNAFAAAGGPPQDILDVGCGTGRLLEAAAVRWSRIQLSGIDVSEKMIIEAQRKHEGDPRFSFKQADASALPFGAASFDVAFSTMSLHHWGEQASGIREVARVLRPSGLFVLADVDVPFIFVTGPLFNWIDGSQFRAPGDIRRLLESAGLSVVAFRRFWPLSRAQLFVSRKGGESRHAPGCEPDGGNWPPNKPLQQSGAPQ
jgi:ubiquinone/menaquinone biosynthesis C-methylase UbiE